MRAIAIVLLAATSAGARGALGQALSDPTRPPAASSSPTGGDEVSDVPSTVLQSVLISPSRKLAVINGAPVALGEKVGDAVLAEVRETEVVLRYPDRVETLKMLGGIERRKSGADTGRLKSR